MDKRSEQILCVFQSPGSVHDFKMYKESIGSAVSSEFLLKADSGYQGLASYHRKSELPTKRSKRCPLTAEEKAANR